MSLAAGSMNRQIVVKKLSGEKDALNRPIKTLVEHARMWADIRGQTGMGVIRGGAEGVDTSLNAYSFRVRYRNDILTTSMFVEYDDVLFDIIDVRSDLKNRQWTDIVCRASARSG